MEIKSLISKFISDPQIQQCNTWGKDRNIFDITDSNETAHSNFLAWLLNPRQGHELGDRFVKELIRQAFLAYENSEEQYKNDILGDNIFFQEWDLIEIEKASFGTIFVEREFSLPGIGNIDICLIDYNNELIVFIENKFGSHLSGKDQLNKYNEWLNDKYDDFYKLYIYLDLNDGFDSSKKEYHNWVGINYDWIIKFCALIVDKEVMSDRINNLVKDYYIHLTEDYQTDLFYKEIDDEHIDDIYPALANEHRGLLDYLNTKMLIFNDGEEKNILDIDHKDLLETIFYGNKKSVNEEAVELFHLYLNYSGAIDTLLDYSKNDHFQKIITDSLPGHKIEFESNDTGFSIFNDEWRKFENDEKETGKWCLYLNIKSIKSQKNQSTCRLIINRELLDDKYVEPIEEIVKQTFNFKRKYFSKDYNYINLKGSLEDDDEKIAELIKNYKQLCNELKTIKT